MKVKKTYHTPDVSHIAPVEVSMGRSDDYRLIFINDYGRYERCYAYWDDIDKKWRYSGSGDVVNAQEHVRTEKI